MKKIDILKLILLGAIWGSSYLLMKLAAPVTGAVFTTAARITISAFALLLVAFVTGKNPDIRSNLKEYTITGVLNLVIPYISITYASHFINTGTGSILNATTPLFTLVLAYLALGEQLTLTKITGISMGIAGVVMLIGWSNEARLPDLTKGVFLSLIGAVSYAVANVYSRVKLKNSDAVQIVTGQMTICAFLLLPVSISEGSHIVFSAKAVAVLLSLALVSTTLGYILFFQVLKNAGAVNASLVTFIIPFFSFFWSSIFLDEKYSISTFLSMAFILSGLYLTVQPAQKLIGRENN